MSTKRILIVEDDEDTGKMLKMMLLSAGYDAAWAVDAMSAKSYLAKQAYDLIILDVSLPAGNGFNLGEFARSNPNNFKAPIIFTTVSGDVNSRERAEKIGITAYFQKPYDIKDLIAKIDEILKAKA